MKNKIKDSSPNATNYLILTDAGKLIFSRHGDEASLSTICGLIQTLRATTLSDSTFGYGDINCINTSSSKIVLMPVGVILLVAIASKDRDGCCDTEDYLHRQLECIYTSIIFALTDEIQYTQQDISYLLGSTTEKLKKLIDEMSLADHSSRSCRWMGGVDMVNPIPPEIRNYTSKVLATECSKRDTIIYAILSVDEKVFNIIQPHNKDHQLSSFDLNLLLHFFDSRTILPGSELWFPICLPRLSQSGFVHCYQCFLGIADIRLTLISQEPSIEEFQYLKSTARNIKNDLGIEEERDQILHVYDISGSGHKSTQLKGDEKLLWERRHQSDGSKNKSDHIIVEYDYEEEKQLIWRKRFAAYLGFTMKQIMSKEYQHDMMETYCNMASVIHFIFRYSVPIRHCNSGADSGGRLCQLFGPPLRIMDGLNLSEKKVWKNYQKLSLILRLGSATIESSLDSYDDNTVNLVPEQDTISQFRPSVVLHEKCLEDDNFISLVDGDELYAALGGTNYEFYAVLPANLSSPSDTQILCTTLVETLMSKGEELQPLSFL